MSVDLNGHLRTLAEACARVGIDHTGAECVRLGENAIFALPGQVVARIARPGATATARREVRVARWLAEHDLPSVTVLDGIAQPVEVSGRAVTFWRQLPPHRHGTPTEVAAALRRLHDVPPPDFAELDPFVRLTERIDAAATLREADRAWLHERLIGLRERYRRRPTGLPACVVHGDAWVGNVVTTTEGHTVLLDLERCSVGPPEWDLVSTAIKHTSFGWISEREYRDFAAGYRHDVTTWEGFELFRDIRELRMACYLAQRAAEHPPARDEAALRTECLRGVHGPRPWSWTPAL